VSAPATVAVHLVLREGEASILHVRCRDGIVVRGTQFRRAFGNKPGSREGPATDLRLTVVRISMEGRDCDFLDSGLTGALTVTGTVPGELGEGWVISQ
jgi:hypothetical protein